MHHPLKKTAILLGFSVLAIPTARASICNPDVTTNDDDLPTAETQPLAQEPAITDLNAAISKTFNVPQDQACVQDKNDPYDPGVQFATGKYKGMCMDTSSVRIPVITHEDEGSIEIANFYHEGKYWTAKIPKNAVDKVAFQITPFDLLGFRGGLPTELDPVSHLIEIAHTQFRVFMKPGSPVELTSQDSGAREKTTLPDLIISTTYSSPKDKSYSPFAGNHAFGITTRALSVQARAGEQIAKDRDPVHQYVLNYTQEEKNAFIVQALHDAADGKYTDVYNLEKNNCTTVSFNTSDKVHPRPEGVAPFHWNWWHLHDEIISRSVSALKDRHLIDKHSEIETMNDDVTCEKLKKTSLDHTMACTENGVSNTTEPATAPGASAATPAADPANSASPGGAQ